MAIQSTNSFTYNYGTYTAPYFRLVVNNDSLGLTTNGIILMYKDKPSFNNSPESYITQLGFSFSNTLIPVSSTGDNLFNKYLYAVSQLVIDNTLEPLSPGSTFSIIDIPSV